MKTYYTYCDSLIGELLLVSDGTCLTGLFMDAQRYAQMPQPSWERSDTATPLVLARLQLQEYFAGRRTVFDVPLAGAGTPFQQRVWQALRTIPYGDTISYKQLAERIGAPNASRAVGLANGRNPLSIVVPCHRVVGANGKLVGYGGGLPRKEQLLALEARHAGRARVPLQFAFARASV